MILFGHVTCDAEPLSLVQALLSTQLAVPSVFRKGISSSALCLFFGFKSERRAGTVLGEGNSSSFLGGPAGAAMAGIAWESDGWPMICAIGAGFGIAALVVDWIGRSV